MAQTKKTNNSFLSNKVKLRLAHLPDGDLSVLDCYGGSGLIWAAIERETGRKIRYISIDKQDYDIGLYLPGDNLAYLKSLNLGRFNVIDLDAYGVPFDQLEVLFERGYTGRVFVTFTQVVVGALPRGMLREIGFTPGMMRKIPTLFFRRGWRYFQDYLALKGVRTIVHRSHARKHYLTFPLSGAEAPVGDWDSQRAEMAADRA
jgi:hypothetical protein